MKVFGRLGVGDIVDVELTLRRESIDGATDNVALNWPVPVADISVEFPPVAVPDNFLEISEAFREISRHFANRLEDLKTTTIFLKVE